MIRLSLALLGIVLAGCASKASPPHSHSAPAPVAAAVAEAPRAAGAAGATAPAAAQPSEPASAGPGLMSPMVERRETLVATGYAVISVQNHKAPAQQRLMAIRAAKLDAYRNLTEQVYGQYLDATTTVADMVVMNDNFRARVEGVIYGATLVSIAPAGDDTYETTLSLDRSVVNDLRALYLGQLAARRK